MVEITDRVLIESLEKKLSNIEVKKFEQSIEGLQKLLSLWKQKQGRFQPDRANNRKMLFMELLIRLFGLNLMKLQKLYSMCKELEALSET